MARSSAPTAFSPLPQPVIPGGSEAWTQNTIQGLTSVQQTTERMTPRATTKAPSTAIDGMVRLARYPWWPVSGQAADAWVYYDGVGKVWRLLSTTPTSSH